MQPVFNHIEILNLELYNFENQKLDISRIFLRINIFENITNQFLTGKIVIVDTQDIISNFPIIGNETLKITLKHDNTIINLEFKIYKIEGDSNNTKGERGGKVFVLYFCSPEKIFSNKISKKYNDKAEIIIQNLLTESKELLFESTSDSIEIYSNFWTIQKIIDFVVRLSKSDKYYDYTFFETLEKFNFYPISFLLNQAVSEKIVYDKSNQNYLMNNNIKSFQFEKYFNLIKDKKFGLFGVTQYQNHITNYSYSKTETDLSNVYEKITSLGKNIPFDKNLSSFTNKVMNNFYDVEISPIRTSMMNLLNHNNLIIKVNGTLKRKSGQVVNLKYPKLNNNDVIQKSFDGNWFINGIHHILDNDGEFEQNLLLSKNAKFDFKNLEKVNGNKNI